MNIIRAEFNKYIDKEENIHLKKFFDDLNTEDGIMLQSFFEDFTKTILEQ